MSEKIGDEHMRAVTLNSIGSIHMDQSEIQSAMQFYSEALSAFRLLGDRRNISTTLQNMACCRFWLGEFGLAIQNIEEAVSTKRQISDLPGLAVTLLTQGEILREVGDVDGAFRSHLEARSLPSSAASPSISCAIDLQIGLDYLSANNLRTAIYTLERLQSEEDKLGPPTFTGVLQGLAEAYLRLGNTSRSIDLTKQVLASPNKTKKHVGEAQSLIYLAQAEMMNGDFDEANDSLRKASPIVSSIQSPLTQFLFHWALGDHHRLTDRPNECYASYAVAVSLFEALRASLPEKMHSKFNQAALFSRFLQEWHILRHQEEQDGADTEPDESGASVCETFALRELWDESTEPELLEACDVVLTHLFTGTPYLRGCISMRTLSGRLQPVRAKDREGNVLKHSSLKKAQAISQKVNASGSPVFIYEGIERPQWLRELELEGSLVCVPLSGREGQIGTLYLDSPDTMKRSGNHLSGAVLSMGRLAGRIIENSVARRTQNAYVKDLTDRVRLMAREQDAFPILLPVDSSSRTKRPFPEIIGESPELLRVAREAEKIASADVTVLITGETGVGKELLAQAIHSKSKRRKGPLAVINCGAIPRDLVEAELFGFERGAFTGAINQKQGRLEFGDKGTVFLDEIGELSLDIQVKLLRFLETKTVERVGGSDTIAIDCRIIAATNRDLEELTRSGAFREDLFYRLSVINLHVPPIRQRGDDALRLANHFLSVARKKYGKKRKVFSVGAIEKIMRYAWPGNVRELQNRIEKAVLMSMGNSIVALDLGFSEKTETKVSRLREVKDEIEISRIRTALKASGGKVALAARIVGLSRQNLYRLIKKHDLQLDAFRESEDE